MSFIVLWMLWKADEPYMFNNYLKYRGKGMTVKASLHMQ